ncbi:MAG: GNAT family N-acetyltransferase [Clostridia bacterium]|nr:GNAT family N-acetyltransferase [Clostridia bacterium]
MVELRSFTVYDAEALFKTACFGNSIEDVIALLSQWENKSYNGKYFEMLGVVYNGEIVGTVSLFEHSPSVISIGPEIFDSHRRKGYAKSAMSLACDIAKERGYKIVSQQIRVNNTASIALHIALGFETGGHVFTNSKGNKIAIYLKSLN